LERNLPTTFVSFASHSGDWACAGWVLCLLASPARLWLQFGMLVLGHLPCPVDCLTRLGVFLSFPHQGKVTAEGEGLLQAIAADLDADLACQSCHWWILMVLWLPAKMLCEANGDQVPG